MIFYQQAGYINEKIIDYLTILSFFNYYLSNLQVSDKFGNVTAFL